MEEKILSAEKINGDEDSSLRPQTLKEYVRLLMMMPVLDYS